MKPLPLLSTMPGHDRENRVLCVQRMRGPAIWTLRGTFLFMIAMGNPSAGGQALPMPGEDIETLEVIEVKGHTVKKTPPPLSFPLPSIDSTLSPVIPAHLRPSFSLSPPIPPKSHLVLLDQTAKARGILTQVKPLHTPHPAYPRRARGQGWHGTVVLRLQISSDGTVLSSAVRNSSGFSLLDRTAIHTTKSWTFSPAKNGEFPVESVVDVPIKFDLIRN